MPQRRIAICGGMGTGKTTCFQSIVDEMKKSRVPFTGFKTYFHFSGALWLEWINQDEETVLMGQKTGKCSMKPFIENLDRIGEILQQIDMTSKIFVVDEIGFLEQLSKNFQRGIYKSVSDAPFSFFTLKNGDNPFLNRLKTREKLQIINLDTMDWQQKKDIPERVIAKLKSFLNGERNHCP